MAQNECTQHLCEQQDAMLQHLQKCSNFVTCEFDQISVSWATDLVKAVVELCRPIMIIQLNCSQGLAIPISILNKYSLTLVTVTVLSFYSIATEKHAKIYIYISELLITTVPPYHYQVKLCQTNIIPIWARKIMLKV